MTNIKHGNFKGYAERSNSAKELVVFVHGFLGTKKVDYWNKLPLEIQKTSSKPTDCVEWTYATNLRAFERFRALLARRDRLASWYDTGSSLNDELVSLISERKKRYDRVTLVGHSMGGIIAALAVFQCKPGHTRINQLVMCATPIRAQALAIMTTIFTVGSNKDSRWLASFIFFKKFRKNIIPRVKLTTKVIYLRATNDEVITGSFDENIADQVVDHGGQHTWMDCDYIKKSAGYLALKEVLKNG